MTVQQLKTALASKNPPHILDVREPSEFGIARLGGTLVPLGELPSRVEELERNLGKHVPIVVLCHHGIRSAQAVALLRHHGFSNVQNLTGGIDRWSIEIDPGVARY